MTPDYADNLLGHFSDAAANQRASENYQRSNLLDIPAINLPKGGGALRSIDEKFQVNAANGTSSLNIPVPFSKSRSDFTPSLSLIYNSGSGNGPFGLGWNISLPSLRRRTDKLLPRYDDGIESDVFQISGAEDLVVKLVKDGGGNWEEDAFGTGNYRIKRYRPRIEDPFTLIEQVCSSAGMYWKTTDKDNTVTFYGLSQNARIADPADGAKVYEWLPEISYDDKGNVFQFFYVAENLVNVSSLPQEVNRMNGNQGIANTYLKRITYGNRQPYDPAPAKGIADPYLPLIPDGKDYFFSLVLDYGDHDLNAPAVLPSTTWGCRLDPFSNHKAGFDIRTYRLCHRFLLFHQFPELDAQPVMVKSLDLTYLHYDFKPVADASAINLAEADLIVSVTESGWRGTAATGYQRSAFPAFSFSYNLPVWNTTVDWVRPENRTNIPEGLSSKYQFTDLYSEGISGILSEQSQGWFYNSNLGDGIFTSSTLVASKPSFSGLQAGKLQLQSLAGDGRKFIVSPGRPNPGYFELTDSQEWLPFMAFEQYPSIDLKEPNTKFIDLNGDGMPEIMITEEEVFTWYPALGVRGYDAPQHALKPSDEEKGPAIVFADPVQCIFLADVTGSGMTDIIRIRNGEICYWAALGYGRFSAKVTMKDSPVFATSDLFNPAYIYLADINGTGATDILYLGQNKLLAWLNLSGNGWGQPVEIPAFPATASPNQCSVTDFLGNGTACIVWSSALPNESNAPLRYIDLMGGIKPYLMKGYGNGMGKQTDLTYRSSTRFYLQDKLAGTPWITKLPFPVHCLVNTKVTDAVSGTEYSTSYTYHHGYYDHAEKEFRGFGRVEQTDTDTFNINPLVDQAPMLTRTWFHTGAFFGLGRILHLFADEYFKNPSFAEYPLPEPDLPVSFSPIETREALRACKGMVLRQEVYALDGNTVPYTVEEHNNKITLLQPLATNPYAVFLSQESEHISYRYERNPADPRIAHSLNTAFDAYGNVQDSYAVVYPRQPVDPAKPDGMTLPGNQALQPPVIGEQAKTYIVYTHNGYTHELINAQTYRLPVSCETIAYQLSGVAPAASYFNISDFTAPSFNPALVKLKQQRILFLKEDLQTPLPLSTMSTLGLVSQQYHLAFNAAVIALNPNMTNGLLATAGYIVSNDYKALTYFPPTDPDGEWWVPSGRIKYLNGAAPLPFYLPSQYLDSFGNPTTLQYDAHQLLIQSVADSVGNTTSVSTFDYRVLQPQTVSDFNGNVTDMRYDRLGMLVAVAATGKGEGDAFDASFTVDLSNAQIGDFFGDPLTNGPALLQGATTRFIYSFVAGGPFSAGMIVRTVHANQQVDARVDTTSVPYQFSFEYTDGLGRSAMKKVQADRSAGAPDRSIDCEAPDLPAHTWIGQGKTVYNNKGKPVMQFEPYFSNTPAFELAPATGVSPLLYYDPAGRLIKTTFPDNSFSSTEFDAWVEITSDQNDNVKASGWYTQSTGSADPFQRDAATKAVAHDQTPAAHHLDTLGRHIYSVNYNLTAGAPGFYATQTLIDLENNPLSIIDAVGNQVMKWDYDLLGRPIHQLSMDSGERWMLHDCMNNPVYEWDNNSGSSLVYKKDFDALQRPVNQFVTISGIQYRTSYYIYGDNPAIAVMTARVNNLRGRLHQQFDETGLITYYEYDFKGNLMQSNRKLILDYKATATALPVISWSGTPADLNVKWAEEYASIVQYDALNRPVMQLRPFIPDTVGSLLPGPYTQANFNNTDTIIPAYGESGALSRVDVYKDNGANPKNFVARICRNEKGQRKCIQYGNSTVSKYYYDPNSFRLTRLLTTANKGALIIQDINYYYDPVGNITYQLDKAQPPVFYNGQQVLADGDYTYDALYRLIGAKGREHIGQNNVNEAATNNNYRNYPFDFSPLPAPGDAKAMRGYTQAYSYDFVGNMTMLRHTAAGGGYTRSYAYNNNDIDRAALGVLPGTIKNNRLIGTTVGTASRQGYQYDDHGNMLNLPHLPRMQWNYRDELALVTQQLVVNGGFGQTVYYNYDGSGKRIRKVTEGAGAKPQKVAERIFLGNFELYRTYDAMGTLILERESLHIMDDQTRIALVDNKTAGTSKTDTTNLNTWYTRYQYGNHLDSVALELDDNAATVSYEEYHPYGTTSFQAADPALDVPAKRYRYTGKERDEESGLYYHDARYYAPWLCRWISSDPIGIKGGINLYVYCNGNCVNLNDPSGNQPSGDTNYELVSNGGVGHDSSDTDDPLAGARDQVADELGGWEKAGQLTSFEQSIVSARLGSGTDLATGSELRIPTGPVYSTVGKNINAEQLRLAQVIRYQEDGQSQSFWLIHQGNVYDVFSREGKLLGAQYDGTGYSMQPGFLATLFDPTNLLSGAIAARLVGSASAGLARSAISSSATEEVGLFTRFGRFFYDPRNFKSEVSPGYWALRGPANGSSLHHWLFPQRATGVLLGFRNAGFNLIELPAFRGVFHRSLSLNTWMGFAARWGGSQAFKAGLVENGIRLAIPGSLTLSAGIGYYLGSDEK